MAVSPKDLFVAWQTLLQMLGEGIGADVAKHVDMAVITFAQALQGAVLTRQGKELVGGLQHAVILVLAKDPGEAVLLAEVERGAGVGEIHLIQRQLVGFDQCQIDLAFVHHAQQVDHFHRVGFLIAQVRQLGLQGPELFRLAAALEDQDALADQVFGLGRSTLSFAIDHLCGHVEIRLGEAHQILASIARDQAGRGERRAAGTVQAGEDFLDVVGRFNLQLDAQVAGKALHQLVFEAGFAIAVLEIGGGAVAGDHAQHTFLLDTLQRAGRFSAATEHQEESGRQQPGGAALSERGLGKHRRSIRKGDPPPYLDRIDGLC